MEKNAGYSLLIFTLLLFFTMVLHPTGGSFAHLLKTIPLVVVTHCVALASLPFAAVGFWGVTKTLGIQNFFSLMAYSFLTLTLVAVLLAGASNGLVLPFFIQDYRDASPAVIESLRPVLVYNSAINKAFDTLYTGGFSIAILLWSAAILSTGRLPRWLAWLGISLIILLIVKFSVSPGVQQLAGLRVFVTLIIAWTMAVAILLIKKIK